MRRGMMIIVDRISLVGIRSFCVIKREDGHDMYVQDAERLAFGTHSNMD